jgi:hypothetical protein
MKNFYKLFLTIFFVLATPVYADTTSDAAYIVDQHMIASGAEKRFQDFNQTMLTNMRSAFANLEVEILDPERFVSELIGDFDERFLREVRDAATKSFLRRLNPDELNHLSTFYRSEAGQVLIEGGVTITSLNGDLDFFSDDEGKEIASKVEELLLDMENVINHNLGLAANLLSASRLADVAEIRGVLGFKSEADRQIIIDYLRNTQ